MDNKFIVRAGGNIISWENGKYDCDNKDLLQWLRDQCERISKMGVGVMLDGSLVAGCNGWSPELSYIAAFAAIQTLFGGRVEMIEGHRPTWEEDLDWKPQEGCVT